MPSDVARRGFSVNLCDRWSNLHPDPCTVGRGFAIAPRGLSIRNDRGADGSQRRGDWQDAKDALWRCCLRGTCTIRSKRPSRGRGLLHAPLIDPDFD